MSLLFIYFFLSLYELLHPSPDEILIILNRITRVNEIRCAPKKIFYNTRRNMKGKNISFEEKTALAFLTSTVSLYSIFPTTVCAVTFPGVIIILFSSKFGKTIIVVASLPFSAR